MNEGTKMLPHSIRSRATLVALLALIATNLALISPAAAALTCFGQQPTRVGTEDDDEIHGTDGSDVIVGRGGDDEIKAGGGRDLICGDGGNDSLLGGEGNDSISGDDGRNRLIGGLGDDLLIGGPDRDFMDGRVGDDKLRGGAEDDFMDGGDGADELNGEEGRDRVDGGEGEDNVAGGRSNDNLNGGGGRDRLDGDDGNDHLIGGPGDDDLNGGPDEAPPPDEGGVRGDWVEYDFARGSVTVDLAQGTAVHHPEKPRNENDVVPDHGRDDLSGIENVSATEFDDDITGSEDANFILPGSGNDKVVARGGPDQVQSFDPGDDTNLGDGDDTLLGMRGGDADGGSGTDEIDMGGTFSGVVVNLPSETVTVGNETGRAVRFENARGSGGSDIILGDDGDNVLLGGEGRDDLNGGAGTDKVSGQSGDDVVTGGDGDDDMNGGDGIDQAGFSTASQGVTADLTAGTATGQGQDALSGFERLGGSGYDDTLIGNELKNVITGKTGNDIMRGMGAGDKLLTGFGDDTFDGGAGTGDWLQARTATAPLTVDLGNNTITGEGNDTITGMEHVGGSLWDDTLIGNELRNKLRGRSGDDSIDGAAGNDVLHGVTGNDTISGGPDRDVLDDGEGTDSVDGEEGDDVLFPHTTGENDSYAGGDGIDQLNFSRHQQGVEIDMAAGTIDAGGPSTVATVENVLATLLRDRLRGDDAANRLEGVNGTDQLVGRGGNDFLRGGGGDDLIDGGDGRDLTALDDAPKPAVVDLFAGFSTGRGNDTIVAVEDILGSIWPDVLRGNDLDNAIEGGDGADSLEGFAGNDTLVGGPSRDFADGGDGTDSCDAERTEACE